MSQTACDMQHGVRGTCGVRRVRCVQRVSLVGARAGVVHAPRHGMGKPGSKLGVGVVEREAKKRGRYVYKINRYMMFA